MRLAGVGKWRLIVTSNRSIEVMSLLSSPTGHLTNLVVCVKLCIAVACPIPEDQIDDLFRSSLTLSTADCRSFLSAPRMR